MGDLAMLLNKIKNENGELHMNDDEINMLIIKLRDKCQKILKKNMSINNTDIAVATEYLELSSALTDDNSTKAYFYNELSIIDKFELDDISNLSINKRELINYCNKLIKVGPYKRVDYKIKTFKNILSVASIKKQREVEITSLNKEILNQDYSLRTNMILDILREDGNDLPVVIEKNGIVMTKTGPGCNESQVILFDYLWGQLIESRKGYTQLILKNDLLDSLHIANKTNDKYKTIIDYIEELARNFIQIDDTNAKDNVSKKIGKHISEKGQNQIKYGANLLKCEFVSTGAKTVIKIELPFIKYLTLSNHFSRYLKADILKHWKQNPRIYWIAREIARLVHMNNQNNKKSKRYTLQTLLANIHEYDRYYTYNDKKKFISRLKKDIFLAASYIDNCEIDIENFTVAKFSSARILLK